MNKLIPTDSVLRHAALALLLLVSASACVTETTGGLPPPAPTEDRVQAQLDLARGYLEQGDRNSARPPLAKAPPTLPVDGMWGPRQRSSQSPCL